MGVTAAIAIRRHTQFGSVPFPGIAGYVARSHTLQCINATPAQIGAALEKLLHKPVVDQTNFTGAVMAAIDLGDASLKPVKKALAAELGIILEEGKREVETYTVTPK